MPPVTGTGAIVSMNSQRFNFAAIALTRLEVLIVQQVNAHRGDEQSVHWQVVAFNERRRHIERRVASGEGDAARLEPRSDGCVHARRILRDTPGPELLAPRPSAGANEHRIAW